MLLLPLLRGARSFSLRPWCRQLSGLCCPLGERRGLLRLRGSEAPTFLQGLMTNDAERLKEGAVYAHLLNVQGRTLYDVILYRLATGQGDQSDILLECDQSALEPIQAHLMLYNLRKKVSIQPCPELSLWAVLTNHKNPPAMKPTSPAVLCTPDPRVAVMGWRLVAKTDANVPDLLPDAHMGSFQDYCEHRYEQGVPEGVGDLPPGVALPLESNLVYMNGISFSKGCYLGQELTARTHHTGVIRKSLLPVRLSPPLPPDAQGLEIISATEKAAGKYRAGTGDRGIALLRLAQLTEDLQIKTDNQGLVKVKATIPEWWPKATDS
ncbi:iron-sulfur cluster assembly factor IBA57, mitochondrial [Pelodytes ibericus]